jgi:signal transduction histidine kinase
MTWAAAAGIAAGLAVGALGGWLAATAVRRARLRRVEAAVAEFARDNFAHRLILPGADEAARIAHGLNSMADGVQREREAAAARESARSRLLANISHDLRTPIASIAGYVDALRRGLGDEPERYLAVIATKTDDLGRLTDDLFYAARLDAGDLELRRTGVDLAEAVRRCVLGFERELADTAADVQVRVPDGRAEVQGDPSAIARILDNLVSNCVRHATGMTCFAIEMLAADAEWRVTVSNDGPPLPDYPERLFRRGVAGPGGGAGLGLSIARGLAERMGGTVTAASPDGGGAAFTLVLPAKFRQT